MSLPVVPKRAFSGRLRTRCGFSARSIHPHQPFNASRHRRGRSEDPTDNQRRALSGGVAVAVLGDVPAEAFAIPDDGRQYP
jgi:hypothetical protein